MNIGKQTDMIKTDNTNNTILRLSNRLRGNKKVYFVRAGDGEFGIATNNHGSKFQDYSDELSNELKESLLIEDENYLIALMAGYENEPGMQQGFFAQTQHDNIKWSKWLLDNIGIKPRLFFNQAAHSFLATQHPELIESFINEFIVNKKKMFIGQVSCDKAEKLLGNSIDEIYENVIANVDDCEIVVSACGPSTNVIAKRLWNDGKHIHFLDIGSLIGLVDLDNATHGWQNYINKKGFKYE